MITCNFEDCIKALETVKEYVLQQNENCRVLGIHLEGPFISKEKRGIANSLVAGIGSAVAITVIPALVEWLESLNDIETKFEDISDIISQDLANVKFDVGLESNEREFLRTIQQAKELKEVLEALGEVRQKSADQA